MSLQKGMSALDIAAFAGQLRSVKPILKAPGVNINHQDKVSSAFCGNFIFYCQ